MYAVIAVAVDVVAAVSERDIPDITVVLLLLLVMISVSFDVSLWSPIIKP